MIDTLHISALKINTRIGVYEWEQRILQQLLIDITIPLDISTCQDNLLNTIDYEQLCQQITTFVESNSFALIETVAEKIAQLIKDIFHVKQLTIRVTKPHAIKNAGAVCITINR